MKHIKHILLGITLISAFQLTSCVQETHLKTITFKVDMRSERTIDNVGVRGNFTDNAWNETLLLEDKDQDSIYEITLSKKTAINQIQFKFVNQGEYELKGQDNRIIVFEYEPETISYEAVFNTKDSTIIKQ